ncbi:hypothetical protein ACNRBV_26130 [Ralstonia pseudosolanacearum]|uniref:hypothetical protein n=1 Tax=Ralstonia pseudosolanacearum TaxID=1310165 RepID=UPI0018D1BD47|nr:hypothetical protein [Ralstonia pseudosolanacearum]
MDVPARDCVWKISNLMLARVSEETVPPGRSQLSSVAYELCKSVCEAAVFRGGAALTNDELVEEFVGGQAERVREIVSAIPSAFHHWVLTTPDGTGIHLFNMTASEMLAAAKNVADMKPEDVVKAYGTVWTHVRALSELRPDAQSKLKRESCLHASRDGVEYVANLYLESDDLVSPLLEWAIVDALILDRIADFASSSAFTGNLPDTPDGQIIEGPLLPGTGKFPMGAKPPTFLAAFGIGLRDTGTKLVLEVVALAASWWLCELLAGPEGLAKWILFTGMTTARWVSKAVGRKDGFSREKEAKGETNLRMLWDMGITHERVPAMNVGLLRHLLYRLEERGAAFSPAVFAVLDKRARREASPR